LLGLTWSDVDLERRQLRVNKALQRVPDKGLVLAETKTRRGRRSIILPIGAVLSTSRTPRVTRTLPVENHLVSLT